MYAQAGMPEANRRMRGPEIMDLLNANPVH
jgi:hypothetical protein